MPTTNIIPFDRPVKTAPAPLPIAHDLNAIATQLRNFKTAEASVKAICKDPLICRQVVAWVDSLSEQNTPWAYFEAAQFVRELVIGQPQSEIIGGATEMITTHEIRDPEEYGEVIPRKATPPPPVNYRRLLRKNEPSISADELDALLEEAKSKKIKLQDIADRLGVRSAYLSARRAPSSRTRTPARFADHIRAMISAA